LFSYRVVWWQAFFEAHPEYARNDFFITGESYAGHYVPAVATRLHKALKKKEGVPINLKVPIIHV
jgi:serine carboxypeptidase-like clade 4